MCDGSKEKSSRINCKDSDLSVKVLREDCHGTSECNVLINANFVPINKDCDSIIKQLIVLKTCSKYLKIIGFY